MTNEKVNMSLNLQYLYDEAYAMHFFEIEKLGADLSAKFILNYLSQVSDAYIDDNPLEFIQNLLKLSTNINFDKKLLISSNKELLEAVNNYKIIVQDYNLPKYYQESSSAVNFGGFYMSFGAIKQDTISKDRTKYAEFAQKLKSLIINIDKEDFPQSARDKLEKANLDFNLSGLTTNIVANILYPISPKSFPLTNGHLSLGFKAFDKINKTGKINYTPLEKLRKSNKLKDYLNLAQRLENEFYNFKMNSGDKKSFSIIDKMFHLYNINNSLVTFDSPNTILYGAPGTGKTFIVKSNIDAFCGGDSSRYEFIQFHPSYTYEDFIEGIKPKGVTQDGNIRFELVNGIFKNFCIKAKNDPDNNYYFIVDEINRANLSAVFGETLSLLESSYRHKVGTEENLISTQYSALIDELIKEDEGKYKHLAYELIDIDGEQHSRFGIPANLYFIGMMNDIDKSIDTFDLALRRRFKWIRKDCDYEVIKNQIKFRNGDDFSNIEKFAECAEDLNKYIRIDLNLGSSYEFGHSFFMKISTIAKQREITSKNLDELFDLYLRPTLREYLRVFYSESEIEAKLQESLNVFKGPITRTQKLDNQDKGTEQNEANSSN